MAAHCCFWRERHLDVSAVNARLEILALTAQGCFNVNFDQENDDESAINASKALMTVSS